MPTDFGGGAAELAFRSRGEECRRRAMTSVPRIGAMARVLPKARMQRLHRRGLPSVASSPDEDGKRLSGPAHETIETPKLSIRNRSNRNLHPNVRIHTRTPICQGERLFLTRHISCHATRPMTRPTQGRAGQRAPGYQKQARGRGLTVQNHSNRSTSLHDCTVSAWRLSTKPFPSLPFPSLRSLHFTSSPPASRGDRFATALTPRLCVVVQCFAWRLSTPLAGVEGR